MGVSEPVLRLDRVTYRYPGAVGAALDAVSLDVAAGEAVGLLGPNGAGKTTLTRLAMALLHPDDGVVISAGRDTARLAPEQLAGTVGYLFQQPESQLFERTVAAELRFGPAQLGWASERIDGALSGVLGATRADRVGRGSPVRSSRSCAPAGGARRRADHHSCALAAGRTDRRSRPVGPHGGSGGSSR